MSAHGLEVIERTVQVTHEWINDLAMELGWESKQHALRLLRTTLHIVRDHLLMDELAQFSAQLPLLVRGMMFESWVPKRTPVKDRTKEGFISAVESGMCGASAYRGPADVRQVFMLLNARVSTGEIQDVRSGMPAAIREYWPEP